jgi:hypothetical protein
MDNAYPELSDPVADQQSYSGDPKRIFSFNYLIFQSVTGNFA